ncbi:MAG: family 10 glycosylhydrolase, partial [Bacillota bacterium]|nr:family 10 glycosylhydrolase [Bacillota bacterium]
MKNLARVTALMLIFLLLIPAFTVSAITVSGGKTELRGLWVASVVNIDYPSKPTTDSETLKSEALKVLDYAKDMGFNAVFLQVRPTADALYKSSYFPWSKFLTGKQGTAPDSGFDPLDFWVTEAHKRGIELHAWINPYRITKNTSSEPNYNYAALDPSNPAILHPNWVVKYSDGNLYFDPGIPEVRKYIIDAAVEIINNYNVDGIHLDDYFYPGKDFNDKETYKKYGAAFSNVDDWRRDNVNRLVGDLSSAIKTTGKKVSFGISPFGIWANKKTNPSGSDTNGMQSYYDQYADTRKWVKDGLLDYIAPQIYWNIGLSVADYSKLVYWWADTVRGTGVDLYIGQAAYKSGNPDPSSPWYGVSEIAKQLELNFRTTDVGGSIFYNYKVLADSPGLSAVIKTIYKQRDGSTANVPVNVSRPSDDIRTSYQEYYLSGSSDPNLPLYLNGIPVEGRSSKGYFGILVPLEKGENIFTFSQDASYSTKVIYRDTGASAPKTMSTADITKSSAFPQSQEYRMPGEKITLSCQAPVGAKVTVKLGSKSYNMTPSTTVSYGTGIYPTTFTYTYSIPSYTGTPRNINLGAPVYTMKYKGKTKTCTAPAKIGVIMKGSPYYARVANDVIDTYQAPVSGDGAAFELYRGMADYITGMTGSYTRLSSGLWVKNTSIETYTGKTKLNPAITNAAYQTGDKSDSLRLDIASNVAAVASFDGTSIKMNISNASTAPVPALPDNSLFSTAAAVKYDNYVQYTLTLKQGQTIDGYYVEKTTNGLALQIKKHIKSSNAGLPLSGYTIMLDPGHGGTESGAIGPLGMKYAEKDINLNTALKVQTELRKLGANVLMTRTTDKTVSLEDRLAASRQARPDMFISIHANAMEDNVDMSSISGLSVHYREALGKPLAETIYQNTVNELKRDGKGTRINNFYVTRGTWTPSILIETGFVTNPGEFEWLTDENSQTQL